MEDRFQSLLQRRGEHEACFGVELAGEVDHAGAVIGPLPQARRSLLSLEA
ncbi:MAG: hypothetical protein NTZ21_19835 [Actinobacteria bacterium]|nr:hypothetical protein [Actinomycetota bacterium]